MSIRTLPLAFFGHCIRRPTYLDVLPVDVIRHHIIPFIAWEDRIHINMLTPPGDRTPPNKIPKDRIIAHQLRISAKIMTAKVEAANRVSRIKRVDAIVGILHTFESGHNILLVEHSNVFRDSMINKLGEFAQVACVPQRAELKYLVHRLLEKIATKPFIRNVKPENWLIR